MYEEYALGNGLILLSSDSLYACQTPNIQENMTELSNLNKAMATRWFLTYKDTHASPADSAIIDFSNSINRSWDAFKKECPDRTKASPDQFLAQQHVQDTIDETFRASGGPTPR